MVQNKMDLAMVPFCYSSRAVPRGREQMQTYRKVEDGLGGLESQV